jgi:hypothetical protein
VVDESRLRLAASNDAASHFSTRCLHRLEHAIDRIRMWEKGAAAASHSLAKALFFSLAF